MKAARHKYVLPHEENKKKNNHHDRGETEKYTRTTHPRHARTSRTNGNQQTSRRRGRRGEGPSNPSKTSNQPIPNPSNKKNKMLRLDQRQSWRQDRTFSVIIDEVGEPDDEYGRRHQPQPADVLEI
jgi:hypothetical protein